MNPRDTIVAVATPLARGGLGVIRIAGPDSVRIARTILKSNDEEWQPWRVYRADLLDAGGQTIDQVLLTYFAAPRSYTADDLVEISCHGSPVVLRHALERCLPAGARLAQPGEFTFRAFLNGRIDLPRAEAVRELIDATTLYQARVAAQQLEGSVSRRLQPAKEQLLELIALLEAGIDFAEDDVPVAQDSEIARRLDGIRQGVATLARSFYAGRLVFGGFSLAVAGRPNVGKSSLFNRLLAQDRAIVTDIPGTTRDTISEQTTFAGVPVKLVDTAGIRESADQVERLGIDKSLQAVADADLMLFVFDAGEGWTTDDEQLYRRFEAQGPLVVANKCDLRVPNHEGLPVSAVSGEGVEELVSAILVRLAPEGLVRPEEGAITSIRHASLLQESSAALENAARALNFGLPHEMLLIDLYAALQPIDAVTGATTADDILNRIFSTFCIGK